MVVLDMVFQSTLARRQIRDLLVRNVGGAQAGWSEFQSVLRWWSFRVPVAYLLLAGVFKILTDLLLANGGWPVVSNAIGLIFLTMLVMAVVSAIRLLPLRSRDVPPQDWVDAEAAYRGE